MGQEDARLGRERDLERLLMFVDAVVAIAITLLVLPLVQLTAEVGENDSVSGLLRTHQPELWSFLLSFAVIARLWFAQHRAVQHLLVADRRLSWLLVLWTLTIVFLPFPTAVVAKAGHQPATEVLYVGTITVSMVAISLIAWGIKHNPSLTDGDELPNVAPAVLSAVLLVLALAVTLILPATSYYPMLLLLLEAPLGRLRQLFRRRAAKPR